MPVAAQAMKTKVGADIERGAGPIGDAMRTLHGSLISPVDIPYIGRCPVLRCSPHSSRKVHRYVADLTTKCGFGTRDGDVTLGYLVSVSARCPCLDIPISNTPSKYRAWHSAAPSLCLA